MPQHRPMYQHVPHWLRHVVKLVNERPHVPSYQLVHTACVSTLDSTSTVTSSSEPDDSGGVALQATEAQARSEASRRASLFMETFRSFGHRRPLRWGLARREPN